MQIRIRIIDHCILFFMIDGERTKNSACGRREDGTEVVRCLKKGGSILTSSLLGAAYPAWYHNLLARRAVTVELGSLTFDATATVITGEEREQLWAWVTQQWPLLVDHQTTTPLQIPLVALQ